MRKNCENCKFFFDFGDEEDAKPREGECRRYPPIYNGKPMDDYEPMHTFWSQPVTVSHWWCGEHKQD